MRSRLISAWNSLVFPPSTATSATPGTMRSLRSSSQSDRALDLSRDVTLDFIGGLALRLGDDLDEWWRRVGIGLDIQRQEASVAETEEARERDHHQQPSRQAECD